MKKIPLAVLSFIFLAGCAGVDVAVEMTKPLAARVYSSVDAVKSEAAMEYKALGAGQKKAVLAQTAGYLGTESLPGTREVILSAVRAMNTDGSAVYFLILSASDNTPAEEIDKIKNFIETSSPAPVADLDKIKGLLKDDSTARPVLALAALGRMSMDAASAAPEIVELMHAKVFIREKYFAAVDVLYKMDPSFAVSILSIDLRDVVKEIRRAALEKMIDMGKYMDKNLPVTKQLGEALMSAAMSADDALSELAKKAVESSGDKKLMEDYDRALAAGKSAIKGLIKFAGDSLKLMYKTREKSAFTSAMKFYDDAKRHDAAMKLEKIMQDRGL